MAGENLPLTAVESVQERRDHMPVSAELKDALTPGRLICTDTAKNDKAAAISKVLGANTVETIEFTQADKGKLSGTLSEQLAQKLFGKSYGAITDDDQKYLIVSLEAVLENNNVNASLANPGDKFVFDFSKGTYSIDRAGAAAKVDGELKIADRVEIVGVTKEKLAAEIDKLEKDGLLSKAMERFKEDYSLNGRLRFLSETSGFAALVNFYLKDKTQALSSANPDQRMGYKGSVEQNTAYLKAYLNLKRHENLGTPLATAPAAPAAPVAPIAPPVRPQNVPVAPEVEGAPKSANPLSGPRPAPLMPDVVPPVPPALPPESPKPEEKVAEATAETLDRDKFLDKEWNESIRPQLSALAEDYPEFTIASFEATARTAFKGNLLTRDPDGERDPWSNGRPAHSKYIEVTNTITGEKRQINVNVTRKTESYADASVHLEVHEDNLSSKMLSSTTGDQISVASLTRQTVESLCTLDDNVVRLKYDLTHLDELPVDRQIYWLEQAAIDRLSDARTVTKDSPKADLKRVSQYATDVAIFEQWVSNIKKEQDYDPTVYGPRMAVIEQRIANLRQVLEENRDFLTDIPDAERIKAAEAGGSLLGTATRVGGERAVEAAALNAAKHVQISEEMEKLSGRNAWGGVEDKYQALLALEGETPSAQDYLLAAQAARNRGDIAEYEKRLKLSQAAGSEAVENDLAEIRDSYDLVELKGRVTVVPIKLPFDPTQVKAIAFANQALTSTGEFSGYLPNGTYTHNGTLLVVGDVAPVAKPAEEADLVAYAAAVAVMDLKTASAELANETNAKKRDILQAHISTLTP